MTKHERLPPVRTQVKNGILLALPELEFRRIIPHLIFVQLRLGQVLYNADNWIECAYFMNSGMASLDVVSADGETVEIGLVGKEGAMGIQAALGENRMFYSGVVQIPGNAMRIRSNVLRYVFQNNAEFSRLSSQYMHDLHLQIGQSAVCNHLHSLEQRLCRCLLASQDHAGLLERLPVTEEFLSHMTDATRSGIMLATAALEKVGLISCRRSGIRIINRPEIEARACKCFRVITEKSGRLSEA